MADSPVVLQGPSRCAAQNTALYHQQLGTMNEMVGKMRAVKNKMPVIPQCPGLAQSASRPISSSGSFLRGPGLTHGGPSSCASCAVYHCCMMKASNLTFSGKRLLMRRARCHVPTVLGALKRSLPLWSRQPLLSFLWIRRF